jgi:hypothetical protein
MRDWYAKYHGLICDVIRICTYCSDWPVDAVAYANNGSEGQPGKLEMGMTLARSVGHGVVRSSTEVA